MQMDKILKYSTDGKVAVIGDIHGRSDLLQKLLKKIPKETQIIVTGDVCDRGPNTKEVIDILIDIDAIGAMGNHEEWLHRWASGGGFDRNALMMGAEATLTSYGSIGKSPREVEAEKYLVPSSHLKWLENLGRVIDLEVQGNKYWVIHSGIPTNIDFTGRKKEDIVPWMVKNKPNSLLWGVLGPEETLEVDRIVIMGHIINPKPIMSGSTIGIDTGCGTIKNGYLSAILLPEKKFIK